MKVLVIFKLFFMIVFCNPSCSIGQDVNYPFVLVDTITIEDPILIRSSELPFRYILFSKSSIDTNMFYARRGLGYASKFLINPAYYFDSTIIYQNGYIFIDPSTAYYFIGHCLARKDLNPKTKSDIETMYSWVKNRKAKVDIVTGITDQIYPKVPVYKYKKFIYFLAKKEFMISTSEWKMLRGQPNIYYKCLIPYSD